MSSLLGVATVEVICVDDRTLSRGTRLSEKGRIISAVGVVSSGTGNPVRTWIEAGVMRGGEGDVFKIARMMSGYISSGSAGGFFGSIPLAPGDLLYLDARSGDSVTVRLNVYIESEVE